MAAFLNVCRFNPTAGGTTDWTYSSAVTGYQSPALAGVVNGTVYKYRAESADLSQWELGEGAYNTGTGVLARTTVLYNSAGTGTGAGQSGAGSKISFSTVPQVAVVALKEDLFDTGAWTPWVPTISAFSGTFTTLGTVTARYKQIGKTVFFYISIPITTNGTAAFYVQATLPFTAANTAHQSAVGRENGLTGKSLAARILSNTANVQATFYDATYPGADGAIIGLSGTYEIQ